MQTEGRTIELFGNIAWTLRWKWKYNVIWPILLFLGSCACMLPFLKKRWIQQRSAEANGSNDYWTHPNNEDMLFLFQFSFLAEIKQHKRNDVNKQISSKSQIFVGPNAFEIVQAMEKCRNVVFINLFFFVLTRRTHFWKTSRWRRRERHTETREADSFTNKLQQKEEQRSTHMTYIRTNFF